MSELSFFDKSTGQIRKNSLGYSQLITTLTAVGRKVSEQKFFEIAPADYMPVVVGNGAFQSQIINWRSFSKDEGFETGVYQNGANKQRLSYSDAAFDEVPQVIYSWAKGLEWNVFQLEQAMKANTLFSLIEALEVARRKSWDLGIQKAAFLGYGSTKGFLNQSGVTVDATTISTKISAMSAAQFNTFLGALYQTYRANSQYTAKPTHFTIPETDYNALNNYPDATYPLQTRLWLLTEALKTITGNQGFKILPCAYGDKANFDGVNNRYVLSSYDETSLKMDLPLDYTMTAAGTVNGFTFENAAYGQFSEVVALRPREMIYFTNTAS
jgi:hypothetical protein